MYLRERKGGGEAGHGLQGVAKGKWLVSWSLTSDQFSFMSCLV